MNTKCFQMCRGGVQMNDKPGLLITTGQR